MIHILQANMNRIATVHDLLIQERGADLLLLNEQYGDRSSPLWCANISGNAVIRTRATVNLQPMGTHDRGDGFVFVHCILRGSDLFQRLPHTERIYIRSSKWTRRFGG